MSFPNINHQLCRFCKGTFDEVSIKYHDCLGYRKLNNFLDQENIKQIGGKMANLKDIAQAYESQRTGNIADLPKVSTSLEVEEREAVNDEGKAFKYKVVIVDNQEYRVPASVLKNLKAILEDNQNLKSFKVKKTGTGLGTEYTVIPLS